MEARFPIIAGALVRKNIRTQIELFCWQRDLKCDIFEDRGLLQSVLYFKIDGDKSSMNELISLCQQWQKD